MSVDPIADRFAFVSGFNYAENSPIANIDLWGLQSQGFMRSFSISRERIRKEKGQTGVDEFDKGLSDGARETLDVVSDEIPVVGEGKAVADGDYLGVAIGVVPILGTIINRWRKTRKRTKQGQKKLDDFMDYELSPDQKSSIKGGSLFRKGKANDFDLIHTKEEFEKSDLYKELTQMSDEDLIKTLIDFNDKWPAIRVKRGKFRRGNNRIYEARKRGLNPEINYIEEYDDTFDYFPDLNPNWNPDKG